jgi:hypothetical protein
MALYRPHGPHRPPDSDDSPLVYDVPVVDDDSDDGDGDDDDGAPTITSVSQLATPRPKRRKRIPWQPGVQSNGTFRDRIGRIYTELDDVMIPVEARQFLEGTPLVVWDRCGCGGGCGLMWVPPERIGDLLTSYPIIHRNRIGSGVISSWRAEDRTRLLLLQNAVSWGRVIR